MPSLNLNNKAEKVRYLLVGAVATTIDFGLLFTFRYLLNAPIISANMISTGGVLLQLCGQQKVCLLV